MNKNAAVKTRVLEGALRYQGETILKYKIEYPEFKSEYWRSAAELNRLYRNKALKYQHYLQTELYDMAVEQYKYDMAEGFPVRMFEALEKFKITYNRQCIISLYSDRYEYTGGAHGGTVRYSQTFNLQTRGMIELKDLFGYPGYEAYLLKEIESRIKKEPGLYFEDYAKLIAENFDEMSFYCTPEGITIYYQQYDIAPYSSGIREFLIPYSYYVTDPVLKCFSQ